MGTPLLKGLLWFDDDPKRDWRQKVQNAAQRHQEKFWVTADVCYVNPVTVGAAVEGFVESVDGVDVYTRSNVLPNHFFIGRRKQDEGSTPVAATATTQLTLL
jgi:hypothetical protein